MGQVNLGRLQYPVIVFEKGFFRIRFNEDELTKSTSTKLKRGFLNNLLIVDCAGTAIKVRSAEKLCGTGLLWGWTPFLNQNIKVKYIFDGEPFIMTTDQLKVLIRNTVNSWGRLFDSSYKQGLLKRVEGASNVRGVVEAVGPTRF